MDTELVDLADRYSRKRALLASFAAAGFVGSQVVAWPRVFVAGQPGIWGASWAVNAILLLAVVATGGGVLKRRGIRALVHDELSRSHLRTAVGAGYWVAMGLGFVLYLAPWFGDLTSRQVIYLFVTGSVAVPLLTFAVLERRAHSNG